MRRADVYPIFKRQFSQFIFLLFIHIAVGCGRDNVQDYRELFEFFYTVWIIWWVSGKKHAYESMHLKWNDLMFKMSIKQKFFLKS